ncbi:hypothetical protein [Kribbella sp. NPDC051620]|uniref:hypothetical protein n=1 Tax=Kribbella sp. NPDC051620 TaxID=3364120 RepID=UPI0037A7188A
MSRHRPMTFRAVLSVRLGVDEDRLYDELESRLGELLAIVSGDVPGTDSAAVAVAHADLWVLTGFVDDARRALAGKEIHA